jgi:hypothetical protein
MSLVRREEMNGSFREVHQTFWPAPCLVPMSFIRICHHRAYLEPGLPFLGKGQWLLTSGSDTLQIVLADPANIAEFPSAAVNRIKHNRHRLRGVTPPQ